MRTSTLYKSKQLWPEINQFVVAIQVQDFPSSEDAVELVGDRLTKDLNLTVKQKYIYPFKPYGVTLVYVLSESHLAIHTWPERKVLHIDLVTCSLMDKKQVNKALKKIFDPKASFVQWLN